MMRFTVWALYLGDDKPRLCDASRLQGAAEKKADRIFDEGEADLVMIHDGERGEIIMALHEGREQALAVLRACQEAEE